MTIKAIITVGFLGVGLMASKASAADWSGLYLGGHTGYSSFSTDHKQFEFNTLGAPPTSTSEFSSEPSGFSGGVHAGYQMQFGPVIAGIEGSYTALNVDDFGYTNLNNGTSTATSEVSDLFAIAARGGFAADSFMAYGKIGYANAGFGFDNIDNASGTSLFSSDDRESGLLLGAGTEFAITDNVSIGLDYTYVNFEVDRSIQELDAASLQSAIEENLDSDLHQLNLRLNFRLN